MAGLLKYREMVERVLVVVPGYLRDQWIRELKETPHRGDPENFRLLLALLDPDLFASAEPVEEAVRREETRWSCA